MISAAELMALPFYWLIIITTITLAYDATQRRYAAFFMLR